MDSSNSKGVQGSAGRTQSVRNVFLIISLVVIFGTIGFMIIESWSPLNSFYMTIITLSTVGFKEIAPLSATGQVWTIVLIICGIGVIGYAGVSQVSQYLIELPFLRNRRTLRKILKMKNHFIICGFGRMGKVIAQEFRRRNQDIVIIDSDPDIVNYLAEHNYTYVAESAIEDETLLKAGVERAQALVAVLSTDADNLFVTLSARKLNPELFILTRCSDEGTQDKMRSAGANKVVNPYEIGGHKMAQMVLSPHVDDFIEIVTRQGKLNLAIDQIRVLAQSSLSGMPLRDAPIRSRYDTIITAVLDSSNEMKFNPSSETVINAGDTLICIGERANLEELEALARGER